MAEDRVSVSKRVAAPAERVWALVSDPAGHARIDGSGMLQAPIDTKPITAAGQTFDMAMDRRPLGDIPNMAEYTVRNTVTRLEPGRLIEWTVGAVDRDPVGHRYGWEVVPAGVGECEVTNYCDWTDVMEALRSRTWPIVPLEMLQQSLDNLEKLATEG